MSRTTLPLPLLAAALLALQAIPATAGHAVGLPPSDPHARPEAAVPPSDRLIVKYRSESALSVPSVAAQRRAAAALQPYGARPGHLRQLADGAHVYEFGRALPVEQLRRMAEALRNGDGDVEYAEPDLLMQPQLHPNDTLYATQQWDLFEATAGIGTPTAWDKSTGAGVTVAVIDTGVRAHGDLKYNLLPGYDFISSASIANDGGGRDADASDPGDWTVAGQCYGGSPATSSSWHGTHVSGTIAAMTNNAAGIAGVAFGARVLPVRVLGRCGGYTSDIADAIVWSAGGKVRGVPANPYPARVLNLSLGGSGACGSTYQNAINTARARGAVVVVAAGNANTDAANASPANCSGVIAVAAVRRDGGKASYSNYGSVVDLAAPGGDGDAGILSTLNTGTSSPGVDSYAYYMGTSMATPHVAGVAALMLSRNPALTPDQLETRLKGAVRPFPAACSGCGSGLLDANAAVDLAGTAP